MKGAIYYYEMGEIPVQNFYVVSSTVEAAIYVNSIGNMRIVIALCSQLTCSLIFCVLK